jgi:hypothetical protein
VSSEPASILGGLSCFGLFWVEPITRVLTERHIMFGSPVGVFRPRGSGPDRIPRGRHGESISLAAVLATVELAIAVAVGVRVGRSAEIKRPV